MTIHQDEQHILFSRLLSGALKCIAEFGGQYVPEVEAELSLEINKTTHTIERYKALKDENQLPSHRDLKTMIPALVRMGIERGMLNEHWAESLCKACEYPYDRIESLVQSLLLNGRDPGNDPPSHIPLPLPSHIRLPFRLPSPSYSHFIPRPEPYSQVMKKLGERKSLIVIHGILGSGKRSLALEVGWAIANRHVDTPEFDAVIWIGNQGDPDPLKFTHILDTILKTLEYHGFLTITNDYEKEQKVNKLLSDKKVLLIIDRFDSLINEELRRVRNWLGYLPRDSKAIIIMESFSYAESKRQWHGVGDVSLEGLMLQEIPAFTQLHMSTEDIQAGKLSQPKEIEALREVTGGNPLAIQIALVEMNRTGSLQRTIGQIPLPYGKITFHDYFKTLWDHHLKAPAKRILMSMTLFKTSVSSDVIAKVADFQTDIRKEKFEEILDQLVSEHLIVKYLSSPPRFSIFPLVRSYAEQQLQGDPLEGQARSRWIEWYVDLAKKAGWKWKNLSQLNILDSELEAIHEALLWLRKHGYDEDALTVGQGVDHYYYIHGHWHLKLESDKIRIHSARQLGRTYDEIFALGQSIQFLCRQGKIPEAEQQFAELEALAPESFNFPDANIIVAHAYAFKEMATHNFVGAQRILERTYHDLVPKCSEPENMHLKISTLHWLATCLYQQSLVKMLEHQPDDAKDLRDQAEERSEEAICLAEEHEYQRSIAQSRYTLANIWCDRGKWESALYQIKVGLALAQEIREKRYIALLQWTEGKLNFAQGHFSSARPLLEKALLALDQLNMPEEKQSARKLLDDVLLHLSQQEI